MRSFLKWAGSKYSIHQHILRYLPEGKRLIEPFTGGGSIFLNSQYPRYLLAEKNTDLIDLFKFLQTEGETFIRDAATYFCPQNNCLEQYMAFRERFNQTLYQTTHKRERALLFLYLNRHSYNGLCRYNSQGYYNVPFGRYIRPLFPAEAMKAFHIKSQQHIEFKLADFRETLQMAQKGDVVYCDPPYVPLKSGFSYVPEKFNSQDQKNLAEIAEKLSKRHIPVLISNHDTPETREYYKQAHIITLTAPRTINCNTKNRTQAKELLALFGV